MIDLIPTMTALSTRIGFFLDRIYALTMLSQGGTTGPTSNLNGADISNSTMNRICRCFLGGTAAIWSVFRLLDVRRMAAVPSHHESTVRLQVVKPQATTQFEADVDI